MVWRISLNNTGSAHLILHLLSETYNNHYNQNTNHQSDYSATVMWKYTYDVTLGGWLQSQSIN